MSRTIRFKKKQKPTLRFKRILKRKPRIKRKTRMA